jgi:site-specific recombinase XerD
VARGESNQTSKDAPYWEHPQVKDFLAYLRLKNISPKMVDRYIRVLGRLFKDVGLGDAAPSSITPSQLRAHLSRRQQQGLAPSTMAGDVLIIRRFFGFLLQEGYLSIDPSRRLPTPKVGQRLPRVLSISELQQLFASIEDETRLGRRDRLFFQLSYAGGLRISEATHLRVEDIDWVEGALRVVGKGDKERRVYLKPTMLDALRQIR